MDFPTINTILFAEDLFTYAMEENGMEWNMPYNLAEYRPLLETYFNNTIGEAAIHINMRRLIESYAFANDFRLQHYLQASPDEAFDALQPICEKLVWENYGFMKVCALVVYVYIRCLENNNHDRAYFTICTFIGFLLKHDICISQTEWMRINVMAEIINRAHDRIAGN